MKKTANQKHGAPVQLSAHDWDFEQVPDDELMACCYWEYARESSSLRDAVKIIKTVYANRDKPRPESAERDKFRSDANKAFDVLTKTGFDISFWVVPPFPEPWQIVDKSERKKLTDFRPKVPTPMQFPPFQVTACLQIASSLHSEASEAQIAQQATWLQLSRINRRAVGLTAATELRKQLEQKQHSIKHISVEGVESLIIQINWREFTNGEIEESFCKWVGTNRPSGIGKANTRGKKKETRWRVMLERLAIMRLLHHATLSEMPTEFPAAWKRHERAEWYRMRQEAPIFFKELFPTFEESPRSWVTSAGN